MENAFLTPLGDQSPEFLFPHQTATLEPLPVNSYAATAETGTTNLSCPDGPGSGSSLPFHSHAPSVPLWPTVSPIPPEALSVPGCPHLLRQIPPPAAPSPRLHLRALCPALKAQLKALQGRGPIPIPGEFLALPTKPLLSSSALGTWQPRWACECLSPR